MESVLQTIHDKYVTLPKKEKTYNNKLLDQTLNRLISDMKKKDELFETIFEQTFYGGSYYDNLKIGNPNEFDLDLLLQIPQVCETHKQKHCGCVVLKPSDKPGFFWIIVKKDFYSPFNGFIEDGYMQTDLMLNWLKGLVSTVLNKFDTNLSNGIVVQIKQSSESGPAITVRVTDNNDDYEDMYIDLVPAFKFDSTHWPPEPYEPNPSKTKKSFFIVPKKAKNGVKDACNERYWRASFQEQERELIEGKDRLKPALRLLKMMRDNLRHVISSYALKTLVLLDLNTGKIDWKNASLSDTFMMLLKKYKESLYKQEIPYYWDKRSNLLDTISHKTLKNHYNEISNKTDKIKENYEEDPCVIAILFLKDDKLELFRKVCQNQNETEHAERKTTYKKSSKRIFNPFNRKRRHRKNKQYKGRL